MRPKIEYKIKRTPYSKTYFLSRVTKLLVVSLERLHFLNDQGKYQEIVKYPQENENGWFIKTPFYECQIDKFPFKVSTKKDWVSNLDSPDTNDAELGRGYIYFPKAGIRIDFTTEGVTIQGNGTWKINGSLTTDINKTFNYFKRLEAVTEDDYLRVTETKVPGTIIKKKIVDNNLEVTYRHGEEWWMLMKRENVRKNNSR